MSDWYGKHFKPQVVWDEGRPGLQIQLPHQCDEWVIGGQKEVAALIADLQKLLPELDCPDKYRHAHPCDLCGQPRYFAGKCEGKKKDFWGCPGYRQNGWPCYQGTCQNKR